MTTEQLNKKTITIGIIISIVLFFAALVVSKLLKDVLLLSDEAALFSSRIAIWVALAILFIYVRQIEKQPLLLWEEKKYSVGYYILSVITTLLVVVAVLIVFSIVWTLLGLKKDSDSLNKIIEIFRHNHFLVLLTCLTAGITEELVFRGYIMPRLQLLFNKTYISVIISSVIFGLIHFGYGTALNVIGPFIIGLVFALHYYKYRNIKILIICHFLWDYIVILLKLNFQPHS
jgi:membrane protease YdiL (CAAX protease family)